MNDKTLVAIVGMGAILPDAFDIETFWKNILSARYSIGDVPNDRWDVDRYYDPDPSVVDKSYSKIGAFVRGYQFDPLKNGIAIPPKVLSVMDVAQQWAIAASHQALKDYGYPQRKLDPERVAIIFGNSNAGEGHYRSTFRLLTPDYLSAMSSVDEFQNLPAEVRRAIVDGTVAKIRSSIPAITEDTMPGELSNIIAGRVANVFNFSGPNYVTDAACASSLAALQGAINGLLDRKFDAVLSGGIDRNMGPESYIKFSKIGALSADGSRPYADGANGFVMGEGAVVFLLKRLEDAETNGDRIYAVIRGIGGSSDGKGKGITAPNPLGQQRAIERAWQDAGIAPDSAGLIEGHGTSTRVGDVAEVNSLNTVFSSYGLKAGSVVLGSVKSNIGHLKSAAGAVGLLKAILSLHHRVLPPTANFKKPNPNIDFAGIPFQVTTEPREWEIKNGSFRFAGVSSFGFGGTNFHVVMEEYLPGVGGSSAPAFTVPEAISTVTSSTPLKAPAGETAVPVVASTMQSADIGAIKEHVLAVVSEKTGYPVDMLDQDLDLEADLGIDTVKQAELFAAIRTHYGIPRREDLRLSDYNTLSKVIGFVVQNLTTTAAPNATAVLETQQPDPAPEPAVALAPQPAQAPEPAVVQDQQPVTAATGPAPDGEAIKQHVLAVVGGKTGYPVEMLDLELDLEADLGIDTVKQAELFAAIRTHYGIPRREDLRLSDYNTLSKVIGFVQDALSEGAAARMGEGSAAPAYGLPAASPDLAVPASAPMPAEAAAGVTALETGLAPYQGLFFASARSIPELKSLLQAGLEQARLGQIPASACPTNDELSLPERIAIDYTTPEELVKRLERAAAALDDGSAATWKALQAHAIYRGSGAPGRVAFLFPGQGSQYVNMFLDLRDSEPVVRDTFDEADRVMTPILGRPLTSFIYTDGTEEELKQAEKELKNTAITQPAMLTADVAVLRVLRKYGVEPDMVIGHSLGEYAALVASGVLTFAEALEVVSARGREMSRIQVDDPGCMAAVSAPLEKVDEVIRSVEDYVVIANINSPVQCVLGGTTKAIDAAIARFTADGFQAVKIPVSHAFHTKIVAPASVPLREVIARMDVRAPRLPIVANVTGELYPAGREEILDILASQVASPVQFVKGMQTLYAGGARIFVECGPKRVLNALATDNLKDREDVILLATNHPRKGGRASFNEALCGIYAAGIPARSPTPAVVSTADVSVVSTETAAAVEHRQDAEPRLVPITGSVVITGLGLGLPGVQQHVFDDSNFERILDGEMRIEPLQEDLQNSILQKHVTRLVKSDAGAVLEEITGLDQVVKLGGQAGEFDLVEEFGIPEERVDALDISSQLAMAAGMEALRDAGIPLVMAHRRTTKGTYLPDRWKLPESMQDETGVVFASAFPGLNRMAEEADHFYEAKMLEERLKDVQNTIDLVSTLNPTGQSLLLDDLKRQRFELEAGIRELDYHLDRRFVFRVLTMGHSQFAEYIGARGPNTHVNAACASTTHAVSVAEDWIRSGRCRRVVVIAGDDITNENLISWIGSSMFASGAATTEGDLRMAALPFDRRRNGMIMGMGAAALVVESEDAARERGVRAIAEILSTVSANSAFHGTRLDVQHVSEVMERLLQAAEQRFGISRSEIAPQTVFMSHETYTPARGGSASAEIHSLRQSFKDAASRVIIANTKGFTGHSMGVGIEDVVALKALETGKVPPIANILDGFEPDPELGDLNLSQGGLYNPQYALRLGAGFGSQIAMSLVRRVPGTGERIDRPRHQQWLAAAAGYDTAELEVVQRTLRVKAQGVPVREPARTAWQYGQAPSSWAPVPEAATRAATPVVLEAKAEQLEVQPEVVAVAVPGAVEAAAGPAPDGEAIKQHVLTVVSEKTGYPVDMLDLDLDLEADLGIDTVKQAELFATIRTSYGIPRREDLRLSDYNTLSKVIGFVQDNLSTMVAPSEPAAVEAPVPTPVTVPATVEASASLTAEIPAAVVFQQPSSAVEPAIVQAQQPVPAAIGPAPDAKAIKQHVLAVVSEKTGYPVDMLDLDLDLEADLGIDTVKQAELFATIRTSYGIPRREDLVLADYNTLAKVIGFVEQNLSTGALPGVPAAVEASASSPAEMPAAVEVQQPVSAPEPSVVQEQQPVPAAIGPAPDAKVIKEHVLMVVSEKTGYPLDMLDLDLDLEADLGIDTVKQAELFAAIRTHYGIPRREDLVLADYNTLAKVIGFVKDALGGIKEPPLEAQPVVSPVELQPVEIPVESRPAEISLQETPAGMQGQPESQITGGPVVNRRLPVPVLFPKLDLCQPTGVQLENSMVIIVGDRGNAGAELAEALKASQANVDLVDPLASPARVEEAAKTGSLAGVIFLPGLDADPDWAQADHSTWVQARSERFEPLYHIARALPASAFLVCATRMGGLHGLQDAANPLGGLVSGFVKAFRRERRGQLAKVVDFQVGASPGEIASALVGEVLSDPVSVEVGYADYLRFGLGLREVVEAEARPAPLREGGVYVVSGGTGGITGPVVADLARETRGTFYLLGRQELPGRDDADLQSLRRDREAFRVELHRRLSEQGEKVTPVQVEQKVAALERAASTLDLVASVEASGGRAVYLVCDVTDAQAVETAVAAIARSEKQVDAFIHAAGFEKSRKIESKPLEEFQQVVSVKADGFYNLFRSLEKENLLPNAVVFFSSVAGRFGNTGQVDYSAANDLLSKLACWLPGQYPGLKAVSIDWGAWAEVGMASRGNIPRLMEMAGIGMLSPASAAPMVREELQLGTCGEVVIAGSLGALEKCTGENCGLDIQQANLALRAGEPIHKMFSSLTGFHVDTGIRLEADLDPETTSYLRDHAINGVPVLPGVMGIEGFSVASRHIASVLASGNGGFEVERLENIQFLAPFKFYGNKPRTIQWNAVAYRQEKGLKVEVTLESDIRRHNGDMDHMLHFTGQVFLTSRRTVPEAFAIPPVWSNERSVLAEDIYKLYFHGPSFQVLDAAQASSGMVLGRMNKKVIDLSAEGQGRSPTPLLIELCFQTAGLFEAGATGMLALPHSVGWLKVYRQPVNGVPIFAEVRSHMRDGRYTFDARVVDARGHVFLELTDYQTSPMPYPAEKDLVEPMKILVPLTGPSSN